MASKKNKNKGASALSAARADVVGRKPIPWGTIIAVVAILALAGVVFGYYLVESAPQRAQADREEQAQEFAPSDNNQDPAADIDGVEVEEYTAAGHVQGEERVAYDKEPPFGGPHDGMWAACNGIIYDEPVRNENMVHTLEHGAIWIAYDPEQVGAEGIKTLEQRVNNKTFISMSPYPELDTPISLQAWGHRLQVDDAEDQRIDNFIAALRSNQFNTPEPNGSCDPPPGFDPANPPPYNPDEPGDDAKPMDYSADAGTGMGQQPPQPPANGEQGGDDNGDGGQDGGNGGQDNGDGGQDGGNGGQDGGN